MILSAIVAVGRNGEIGQGGALPWPRLKEDMKWFRDHTMGKPCIMGRKTWDSLMVQPLPHRHNIVLSRTWPGAEGPINHLGCDVVVDVESALRASRDVNGEEVFIIGGSSVYDLFWDRLDRVYMTLIDAEFPDSDASLSAFPLSPMEWGLLSILTIPNGSPYPLTFQVLNRKRGS